MKEPTKPIAHNDERVISRAESVAILMTMMRETNRTETEVEDLRLACRYILKRCADSAKNKIYRRKRAEAQGGEFVTPAQIADEVAKVEIAGVTFANPSFGIDKNV